MGTALVVYESMWGNTEKVARAVAEGLASEYRVEVHEVGDAPASPTADVELIVVGGPTHAFSLTRASTRQDARRQGADHGGDTGLREWLDGLPSGEHPQHVATFDTRVEKMRHLPGSAAKSAARVAHRHGYERAVAAESFYVADTDGPLIDGELERASAWGRRIAADLQHQPAAPGR